MGIFIGLITLFCAVCVFAYSLLFFIVSINEENFPALLFAIHLFLIFCWVSFLSIRFFMGL